MASPLTIVTPWAVSFPFNSPAYKSYLANAIQTDKFSLATLIRSPSLHPTQLYEAAGALISSVFALVLIRKRIAPGIAALSAAFFFFSASLTLFPFQYDTTKALFAMDLLKLDSFSDGKLLSEQP